MIPDLDESLQKLLIDELPIRNGEVDISFHQPKRDWSARLSRPTINLFLYDVRENMALRNQQWERMKSGNLRDHQAQLKRSPLRVDCTYLLTAWASEPEDEHQLLARCLATLFQFPVIPPDHLAGSLKNQPYELQIRLASPEMLVNPPDVWNALDNELRPTIPLMITLAIDPWQVVTAPLVRSRVLRAGQAERPWKEQMESLSSSQVTIAGTVWDQATNGSPQPGIAVAVKGTGLFTTSDPEGRFVLGSLPAGEYTLVAWPAQGRPVEKKVSLPAAAGDYDLVIGSKEAA